SGVASSLLMAATMAGAADLPGSRDPDGFRRFEGSGIIHYATSPPEPYGLARGEGAVGAGFEKQERVEGSIVRVVYKAPLAATAAEIFRSYRQMLTDLGF